MIGMSDIMEDCEEGYLDTAWTLELFAELIRTGRVWNLGSPYLNEALHLIDSGYVTPGGKITSKGRTLLLDEGREGSPCDVNPEISQPGDLSRGLRGPYPRSGRRTRRSKK